MTFRSFWKGPPHRDAQRAKRRAVQLARHACYLAVETRAKRCCERCGVAISAKRPSWHPQRAHMNHRLPLSLGGLDTPENCELICQSCHLPGGRHAPTKERM